MYMKKSMKPKGFEHRFLFLLIGLFLSLSAFAQQITVKGHVVDATGEPVIGASIVQEKSTNGTITDIDGNFSLSVPANGVLTVSFIGYVTQSVSVGGKTTLSILLKEDTKVLDEVVVVGYGTMKKSDLTGAVSSVGGKDMSDKPVANIGEALQGRASGVQIVNSGKPGDNVTLKIRGLGTINNSDPLVVIDGVPTDLGLNALNMDDVETVDVLKDASATAIYGSRGANGVVMITTKKGKAGKGTLSLKASYGIQQVASVPSMLDASQYAALNNEMMDNAGKDLNPAWSDPASLGRGTDWLDLLFRTAALQNYSVSYSGGTDTSNYYVSGGVLDQEGVVINTGYRRFTAQFNGEAKPFNWLKFTNRLTLSHDIKNQGSYDIRKTMGALPTQPLYFENGGWSGPVGNAEWVGDIRNPIGTATIENQKTRGYNILGNISAEISIYKGLQFKTVGGIDAKFWDKNNFTPAYQWQPIPNENSSLYKSSDKSITYLWDNYFTYDGTFGKHRINAMAGMSAQNNVYDYFNGAKNTFLRDENHQMDNGTKIQSLGGNGSEWALLSYIARANYSYADRYLLTATVRRDGSSRFAAGNRWGTFPSFSAAWRMSEESWFRKSSVLNDLKLRAGYGITGNQNIGNYSFASIYNTGVYTFNGSTVSSLVALKMPNPNVSWEEVQQANIGIDLGLFNQRVNLSVDAYLKNTNDMLVPMSVPISTGYSDQFVPDINAGKVQNKGVEISLQTQNFRGAFEWNTSFNVSYNTNKIKSLNSNTPMYQNTIEMSNVTVQAQGHPINSFYGFVTDGIFQTVEEVDDHAVQVVGGTAPGDIRFKDLDNNGVIDDNDRTFIGNPTPEWMFAMNNSFHYKDFDLEIFFQGVAGNDIYNANRIWQEGMSVPQNQTTAVLNRWTGEGTSNLMPRAVYSDPNKNTRHSDRFIEDGSYLRLKNVTLGYSLPKSLLRQIAMNSVRIYLSAQNLFTLTSYSGFDPEVGLNGIDNGVYPLTRTYSIGLNINF